MDKKVKLKKTEDLKWCATIDGEVVGSVIKSALGTNRYVAILKNGKEVFAFNQPSLKRLILKYSVN